jgi:hypothetical protein
LTPKLAMAHVRAGSDGVFRNTPGMARAERAAEPFVE